MLVYLVLVISLVVGMPFPVHAQSLFDVGSGKCLTIIKSRKLNYELLSSMLDKPKWQRTSQDLATLSALIDCGADIESMVLLNGTSPSRSDLLSEISAERKRIIKAVDEWVSQMKTPERFYQLNKKFEDIGDMDLFSDQEIETMFQRVRDRSEFLKKETARASLRKEGCGNSVDLSDGFPPTRDQEFRPWCQSYAAADLMGFAKHGCDYKNQRSEQEFSMLHLAMMCRQEQYHQAKRYFVPGEPDGLSPDALYEGCSTHRAVEKGLKNGVCRETPELVLGSLDYDVHLWFLEFEQEVARPQGRSSEVFRGLCVTEGELGDRARKVRNQMYDSVFALMNQQFAKCSRGRITFEGKRPREERSRSPGVIENEILNSLDLGRPLAASIATESFLDGSTGDHAMIAVGKSRNAQGKCMIHFRNSWGTSCDSMWKPFVKCDPKTGNISVPLEELMTNIKAVSVVEPSGPTYKNKKGELTCIK